MGFFNDIKNGIKNLIGNDPEQYVADEDKLENVLILGMNNTGKAKISPEDAALLAKAAKDADKFAQDIDDSQGKSIILHASDMIIRASNGIEKWVKQIKANKKLTNILAENYSQKDVLPKDEMVKAAESTNGKVKSVSANELKNQPRELGGKERDSRAE